MDFNKPFAMFIRLLLVLALAGASSSTWAASLEELRQQKIAEEKRIEQELDQAVRSGKMTPQEAKTHYGAQLQKVREDFKKQDPLQSKLTSLQSDLDKEGLTIISTGGSKNLDRKDINADFDGVIVDKATGKPPTGDKQERAQELQRQHFGSEGETPGKFVDKETDITTWKPKTPEAQEASQHDDDSFITQGGLQATGNPGMKKDELGEVLDNELKYKKAQKSGDLKTQGKSLSKIIESEAGKGTPKTEEEKKLQAIGSELQKYKTTSEAGLTTPGDSDAVKGQKIEQFDKESDAAIQKVKEKAQQKSELRDKIREDIEKGYKKSPDPEIRVIGDDVAKEREAVKASNKTAQEKLDALDKKENATTRYTGGVKPADDGEGGATTTSPAGTDDDKESVAHPPATGANPEDNPKTQGSTTKSPGATPADDTAKTTKEPSSAEQAPGKSTGRVYGGSGIDEDGTKTTTKSTYQDGQKVSQESRGETKDGVKTTSKTTFKPDDSSHTDTETTDTHGNKSSTTSDTTKTPNEGGGSTSKTVSTTSDTGADGSSKVTSSSSTDHDTGAGSKWSGGTSKETEKNAGGETQKISVGAKGGYEKNIGEGSDDDQAPKKPDSVSKSVKIAETTLSQSDTELHKVEGASVHKVGDTEISSQSKLQLGQKGHQAKAELGLEKDESGNTALKGELAAQAEKNLIKMTSEVKTDTKLSDDVSLQTQIKNETKVGAEVGAKGSMAISKDAVKVEVNAEIFAGFKSKTEGSITLDAKSSLGIAITGKGEIEVSAGAGATGKADAELSWTKIKIEGGVAATLGLGAGGKGSVELDAGVLITGVDDAQVDLQNKQSAIIAKITQAVKKGDMQLPEGKRFSDLINDMRDKAEFLSKHPELLPQDNPDKLTDTAAAALAANLGIKAPEESVKPPAVSPEDKTDQPPGQESDSSKPATDPNDDTKPQGEKATPNDQGKTGTDDGQNNSGEKPTPPDQAAEPSDSSKPIAAEGSQPQEGNNRPTITPESRQSPPPDPGDHEQTPDTPPSSDKTQSPSPSSKLNEGEHASNTPPAEGQQTVEKGWVENAGGRTKLHHTYDNNGNLVSTTEVDTDATGKVTEVRSYPAGNGEAQISKQGDQTNKNGNDGGYNPLNDPALTGHSRGNEPNSAAGLASNFQKGQWGALDQQGQTASQAGSPYPTEQSSAYTTPYTTGSSPNKGDNQHGTPTTPPTDPGQGTQSPGSGGLSDVVVSSSTITVSVWDHGTVDGDIVNITLNGASVAGGVTLAASPKTFTLKLSPGNNTVSMYAVNEGSLSPNTASIKISHVTSGKAEQTYSINQKTSASFGATVNTATR